MAGPMPNLDGSELHRLCVDLYARHRDAGTGFCATCGFQSPCPARRHAATVIAAAGHDPRRYDAHPAPERAAGGRAPYQQHRPLPARGQFAVPGQVEGYSVGGIGRRADLPYRDYER